MGLSNKDKLRFEELDKIAYEMFQEGYSLPFISEKLKVKRQSLTRRLKEKYNITYNLNGKKNVNSNFFSILNEKSIYWLGFIFADGNVSQKGNYLEITIKDKDHLEKFKKDINSNHKISCKKINNELYWRISISDKTIISDLIKLGVKPRKSFIDIEYPTIPKELELHFIRGFIDGDGCYNIIKKSSECYPMIEITIGFYNKKLAEKFYEILNSYGVKFNLYKSKSTYKLMTTRKYETLKFINMLYDNSTIYLDRKYNKIKKYCRLNSTLQKN